MAAAIPEIFSLGRFHESTAHLRDADGMIAWFAHVHLGAVILGGVLASRYTILHSPGGRCPLNTNGQGRAGADREPNDNQAGPKTVGHGDSLAVPSHGFRAAPRQGRKPLPAGAGSVADDRPTNRRSTMR